MIAVEPASEIQPDATAGVFPPVIPTKIQPHHRDRLAVVYVRQSSPQQVLEHRESTALQYNLRCRAIEWGWGTASRSVHGCQRSLAGITMS